jgi:hypothetical protein
MKYTRLTSEAKKEQKAYQAKALKHICENDSVLRSYSTATRWNQYKAGTITKDEAIKFASARIEKHFSAEIEKALDKLAKVEAAEEIKSISISVEWKKSRIWGMNPTAEVTVTTVSGLWFHAEGHAIGCGYDKESAAVAEALNALPQALKLLYDAKERSIRKNGLNNEYSNARYIEYGAGYGALPYFEGGVGYSCFRKIFCDVCGFAELENSWSKTSNHYYYTR